MILEEVKFVLFYIYRILYILTGPVHLIKVIVYNISL